MKRTLCLLLLLLGSGAGFALSFSPPAEPKVASGVVAGVVAGVVVDQSGATIPQADVKLTRPDGSLVGEASTNDGGLFRIQVPASGHYQLDVQRTGFEDTVLPVTVNSGPNANSAAPVKILMRVAALKETVTVGSGDTPQVSAEVAENQSANTVDRADLDHLPIFDMDYIGTLSRFLTADATGTNGVTLVVNGLEANGPGVPPSAIKNVKINQNPYSALFSRPGRARIEITTEEGTPEFHGSANFLFRDSVFDARNAFNVGTPKPAERRTFEEGTLTGPLGSSKKNTFLLSGENDNDDQQAFVDAVISDSKPPQQVHDTVPIPDHHLFLAARGFHDYGQGNQLWISYSYEYELQKNQGVGGNVLREAATNYSTFEHEVNVGYTRVFSPHALNQLRFLVGYNDEQSKSVNTSPSIIVQGAFTGGGAQGDLRRTEGHFDGVDLTTYTSGKHELKFGVEVPDISRRGFEDQRLFGGQYSFASLADYADGTAAAKPNTYTVTQGTGHATFVEKVVSGFFEDTIRLRSNLSVAAGVRYYWQNYFHDIATNFAPRFSMAYAVGKKSGTVLRAGGGIFYDRTGPRAIFDTVQFDGKHLVKLIANNPTYPVTQPEIAAQPPGIVQLAPRQRIPYQFVFSAGVEKQVTAKSTLAMNYVGTRGIDQFRSIDANAPMAPNFAVRPNPAYGQIREIQSDGYLKSNAMEITFRGKPSKFFSGQAQYTLSKTYNNNSGIKVFPADSYAPDKDWGRSDNDMRHKFDMLGSLKARELFELGMALSLYSGKPVDVTTGSDENGDGMALDRPAGVPRNSMHGPGYASLDLNFTHEFSFHKGKEEGRTLAVSLNAFNMFNHPNYVTYVGVAGSPSEGILPSPSFGHAVAAQPGRRLQLNLEYKF